MCRFIFHVLLASSNRKFTKLQKPVLREGEKIKDLCSEHIVLPKPKWETILQLMTYLIKRKKNYQKELYSVVIIIFFTASFKLAWFS